MLVLRILVYKPGGEVLDEVIQKEIRKRKDGTYTKDTQRVFSILVDRILKHGEENVRISVIKTTPKQPDPEWLEKVREGGTIWDVL